MSDDHLFPERAAPRDLAEIIQKLCTRLGRPERFVDNRGYEHEIVGAAISDDGSRQAWIEGRSKWLNKETMDIEYRLKAIVDGRQALDWEVATYNPFFGCDVGMMAWRQDTVVVVYTEKHQTIVASVPLSGVPRLFTIEHEWVLKDNAIYTLSEAPGLVEGVTIPDLRRTLPLETGAPLRALPLPEDAAAFRRELQAALFPPSAPAIEADMIVGSLAYRFWDRWPEPRTSYPHGRRWNPPSWLPFYWHESLPKEDRGYFLDLLDYGAAQKTCVSRRCAAIADACRKGSLPEKVHDSFWAEWSVKAFEKSLDLFPDGFRRAFEILRPISSK